MYVHADILLAIHGRLAFPNTTDAAPTQSLRLAQRKREGPFRRVHVRMGGLGENPEQDSSTVKAGG